MKTFNGEFVPTLLNDDGRIFRLSNKKLDIEDLIIGDFILCGNTINRIEKIDNIYDLRYVAPELWNYLECIGTLLPLEEEKERSQNK